MLAFVIPDGGNMKILFAVLFATLLATGQGRAACLVHSPHGPAAVQRNQDLLAKLLKSSVDCPPDVFAFRRLITTSGGLIQTTLVANRGFHNPPKGSFSLFEIVTGTFHSLNLQVGPGEFFFGHFTAPGSGNTLIADQAPAPRALMIELIAWDPSKKYFNFYELRGDGQKGIWIYQGDSRDILSDTSFLHLQAHPSKPIFGRRLRCSGCHTAGGPIMKELSIPHNDWWTNARGLPLGGRQPDDLLRPLFQNLAPASLLAAHVDQGLKKLQTSPSFQALKGGLSLQQQLKPLFCPIEVNLGSDIRPLDAPGNMIIPADFFVDRFFSNKGVAIDKSRYLQALASMGSHFPETQRADGDHGWLTPVKAWSDHLAIQSLLRRGQIDIEFVGDVLAVDMTNPVFSRQRCELLKLVPNQASSGWKSSFAHALRVSSLPGAQELFQNLTEQGRSFGFHRQRAQRLLEKCRVNASYPAQTMGWVRLLAQRRNELKRSEISKNPLGQILEPGFRIIFSEPAAAPGPGQFKLDDDCRLMSDHHLK
jgi:hypothetical protein